MNDAQRDEERAALARALRDQMLHRAQFHRAVYTPAAPSPAPSAGAGATAVPAAGARENVAVLQKRVRRDQARAWPAAKKLAYLRDKSVGDCQRCPLARGRKNLVFGAGDPEADIMFVGEAPGHEEDLSGEPFVGAAGKRLDAWLDELGLARSEVYIANVLKCRPPGNRDPGPREIETCSPFLRAQIRAIEPRVIVTLGRFAGNLLLGKELKLYEMRRGEHWYEQADAGVRVPLVATYHPAYILRRVQESRQGPSKKSEGRKSDEEVVLDDLRKAVRIARASDG